MLFGDAKGHDESLSARSELRLLRVNVGAGAAVFQEGRELLLVREGDTLGAAAVRVLALGIDGVALELPLPGGASLEYRVEVGELVRLQVPEPAPARARRLWVTDGALGNDD